jgi:hypothetical protein
VKLLAALTLASVSYGQSPAAAEHLNQLYEHWLWQAYWEGATDLDSKYTPGRQFSSLFFWQKNDADPSIGFCSEALGFCRFYQSLRYIPIPLETKITSGEDSRSAFQRFLGNSFGKYDSPLGQGRQHPPAPSPDDYAVEMVTIALPALDPPNAIRERNPPPRARTDALLAKFGCSLDKRECDYYLLIPFYSESDFDVPIYRECLAKCNFPPAILFPKWIDEESVWWQGAMDITSDPAQVKRFKQQIEKALLVEVGKPKP